MTGDGAGIDWHKLYRGCADAFGWTPHQVDDLTLEQMAIVLGGEDEPEAQTFSSLADLIRHVEATSGQTG